MKKFSIKHKFALGISIMVLITVILVVLINIGERNMMHYHRDLADIIDKANLQEYAKEQLESVNEISKKVKILSISSIIISLISAIIVFIILINETIKPLNRFIKRIKKMNQQEIYETIDDIQARDEIGDMIIVFNRMVGKMNDQQVKLQDQNEELMAQGEELSAQNEEILAQQQELQESLIKLAKHEERINRLYQFSKLLNQTIDREQLIKDVLHGLLSEVNAQVGTLALYNGEKGELETKYTSGLSPNTDLSTLKLGQGLAGQAAYQRKIIVVNYNEGQLQSEGLLGPVKMASEAYVPLVMSSQLLGVISLGRLDSTPFGIDEQRLLAALADQIAVALDNASTHLETQRALDKVQEVDQLKSEMISTVSHELRTPLSSILGFVELLLKRSPAEVKAKKYLTTIHNEAERLNHLINDFLDLQKIETGKLEFVRTGVNLNEILQNCIDVYSGHNKHHISLDVEEDLPIILTDPDRISQVVGNLLSNAIKYSPGGGQIEVKTYKSKSNEIKVMIKDQGLGIPEEAQESLFQPFFRVDNSDRRQIGGTGLGLAICRRIIRTLGGKIWVESIHGKGSNFIFTLPL